MSSRILERKRKRARNPIGKRIRQTSNSYNNDDEYRKSKIYVINHFTYFVNVSVIFYSDATTKRTTSHKTNLERVLLSELLSSG
jgi:hypothetical protein